MIIPYPYEILAIPFWNGKMGKVRELNDGQFEQTVGKFVFS